MNKLVLWLIIGLIIGIPLLVKAADTRLGSTSPYARCFTATVVSGATCYTADSATTVSGTTFNDIKLIDGTNPRMPGLWGKLAGTTSVDVESIDGTSFTNSTLIGGTTFLGGITGTSYTNANIIGGTVFVGPLVGTSYTNSTIIGGTVFVGPLVGTSYTNSTIIGGTVFVGPLVGTSYTNSNIIGGTVFVGPLVGTSYTNSNIIGGTVFVGPLVGTSYTNSVLIGGTTFLGGITGTSYSITLPNAIVTEGVSFKTVSTSGTSLRLASQAARAVIIKANCANTNYVYVVPGGTTAQDYSSTAVPGGLELDNCESVTLPLISNIQEIVIDTTTNGEGINYTWVGY